MPCRPSRPKTSDFQEFPRRFGLGEAWISRKVFGFQKVLESEKEILLSRLINMPVSATCGSSWRIRLQDQRRRRRYVAFWKFQLPDDIEHNLITHGKPCNRQAYCLAHQLTVDGDHRRLMIATLRYLDTFAKVDGAWLLAERPLYVDWIEERTLS